MIPSDVPKIPAMTTDAERLLYYRLARELAGTGAVVELGAWLGASTAYLAAALRDSGAEKKNRAYVYDRWVWQASAHEEKGGPLTEPDLYRQFKKNLGPLLDHVKPYQAEIGELKWDGGPIALLVADAPKRVSEISHVLGTFAGHLRPGSVMAWQDFAHFPSFAIPACLHRLGEAIKIEACAVPGTTVAFRVRRPWEAKDVAEARLDLGRWSADEITEAWARWRTLIPEEWHARFRCGEAMFLHDIGKLDRACSLLRQVVWEKPDETLPKWRYLKRTHKSLAAKYWALFEAIDDRFAA